MRQLVPASEWGWLEVLLNRACYLLSVLVWQNSEDGHKGKHQPTPFEPPFIKKQRLNNNGVEPKSIDDIKQFLSAPRS